MSAREEPLRDRPAGWPAAFGRFLIPFATILWLSQFAIRQTRLQWDFRVYLAAARAARAGLDPYVPASLARVTGQPAGLPFLYPPVALLPFLALSHLSPLVAAQLWIGLKVGITIGLIFWWAQTCAREAGIFAVALLALLGSNAASLADLRAGNVGLVEAGLLWGAFGLWIRGRPRAFAALVVVAATFKLAPAVFLALLLVPLPGRPARPRIALAALAALGALVLVPFAVGPAAAWRPALAALGGPFPVGEANPSAFALALSLARGRVAHPGLVAGAAWLAWCAALVAASVPALRRLREAGDARGIVAAAVALDLLLSPRPMAYGFALGGGALAWLVARAGRTWIERAGLVVLLCLQGFFALRQEPWTGTLGAHATLLAWAGLWALFLARARGATMQSATAPPPAGDDPAKIAALG